MSVFHVLRTDRHCGVLCIFSSTYSRWQHYRSQVQVGTRRHVVLNRPLPGNRGNDMTELHQAAATGNVCQVEEILRQNKCNPNQRDVDWSCKTPLHWAAAKGHTETVRILIEHGARPCLRTEHGWTPAHFAAESGRLAVLRLLHSLHAPIDKEDCCGDKPVRIAEIYGHQDCVGFLKKAEIECQAYRKMATQKGISVDDTDEEWAEQGKGDEENRISKSNIHV